MPSLNNERYRACLKDFPAPGNGAHTYIFKTACFGARAGLTPEQVIEDIRRVIPEGTRVVPDSEIEDGVAAGFRAVQGGEKKKKYSRPAIDSSVLHRFIQDGRGATEADISARSPIPVETSPVRSAAQVLEAHYAPDEFIFIGDDTTPGRKGENIRSCDEWVSLLRRSEFVPWPKIMVNPLTGRLGPKKSGGESLRADSCVAFHRFVLGEFDNLPISDQLAFWMAVPHLPVAALILSGKKSIHAWIRVDCKDSEEWEAKVKGKLFPGYFAPLGMDASCSNASRLSRMPGHLRAETSVIQRCFYLAPNGKAVNS